MKVTNITKNCLIADKVASAHGLFSRIKGLLGRKGLDEQEGLFIKPCTQIHTWFMRFPIDVLFIDKNDVVIHLINDMRPFRISGLYFASKGVLELASGVINRTKTEVGDSITIV